MGKCVHIGSDTRVMWSRTRGPYLRTWPQCYSTALIRMSLFACSDCVRVLAREGVCALVM